MERTSRREDGLFVQPCEKERKFGNINKTARSEHMTYVVDQIAVVADLIIYKYSFTDGKARKSNLPPTR